MAAHAMSSTGELILQRIPERPRPQRRGAVLRCASPLRPDSNSLSFALCIHADGEHGWFKDHVSGDAGSLYTLAERLGIEPVPYRDAQRTPDRSADSGAIVYRDLSEYAQAKGVTPDVFASAGWRDGVHRDRRAILYPVMVDGQAVDRVRYLDAQGAKYTWAQSGGKAGWYGLGRAITKAHLVGLDVLYIVNGEASVVVAQHHGVPAACVTGGESTFNAAHVQELLGAWDGYIAIALDCDRAGRDGAARRKHLIADIAPEAADRVIVVELGLHQKGDMADFCMLHSNPDNELAVLDALRLVTPRRTIADKIVDAPFVSMADAAHVYEAILDGNPSALMSAPQAVPITWAPAAELIGDYAAGGKVIIGPVSASGVGKTMVLEWWLYNNMLDGVDTLFVSPEWQPVELMHRMAMRVYTGTAQGLPPMPAYIDWLKELANLHRRLPSTIQDVQLREAIRYAVRRVSGDMGRYVDVYNIRGMKTTQMRAVLDKAAAMLEQRARAGRPYQMVIFDYVSVFDLDESKANEAEALLNMVKEFAMTHNVLVVTSSQVNKEAARRIANDGGRLYAQDAYGVREDKANYMLMATPYYLTWNNVIEMGGMHGYAISEPDIRTMMGMRNPDSPARDEGGALIPSGLIVLSSAKNSVKGGSRRVYLQMDYKRLAVLDYLPSGGLPDGWAEKHGRLEYSGPRYTFLER